MLARAMELRTRPETFALRRSAGAYFAAAEVRLRSRMPASVSVPDAPASACLPARDRPLRSSIGPCFIEEDGPELSEWPYASPEPC